MKSPISNPIGAGIGSERGFPFLHHESKFPCCAGKTSVSVRP